MASGALRPAQARVYPRSSSMRPQRSGATSCRPTASASTALTTVTTRRTTHHQDNSSQYGTWLNEERLEARPLRHGDVVKLARDVRREAEAEFALRFAARRMPTRRRRRPRRAGRRRWRGSDGRGWRRSRRVASFKTSLESKMAGRQITPSSTVRRVQRATGARKECGVAGGGRAGGAAPAAEAAAEADDVTDGCALAEGAQRVAQGCGVPLQSKPQGVRRVAHERRGLQGAGRDRAGAVVLDGGGAVDEAARQLARRQLGTAARGAPRVRGRARLWRDGGGRRAPLLPLALQAAGRGADDRPHHAGVRRPLGGGARRRDAHRRRRVRPRLLAHHAQYGLHNLQIAPVAR